MGTNKNKGSNKAVWIFVAIAVALVAAAPKIVELLTGQYQDSSLQVDVNSCTKGMSGQVQPTEVTNVCDYDIVVGMCLSDEVNPMPCTQTLKIKPHASAQFDPKNQKLSSLPSNPNGLTIVACRINDRPSRTLNVGGRGYRGVCLPAE